MPYASAISTHPDPLQASQDLCRAVRDTFSDSPVQLACVFLSPHHIEDAEDIARQIVDHLRPHTLIGCVGDSIVGNDVEIEDRACVSLFAANFGEGSEVSSFHLQTTMTGDGPSILGWPDALFEVNPVDSLMILLGDPYTFPTSELFLPRINEDYPGLPVVGGMSSHPGPAGAKALLLQDRFIDNGAVGVLLHGVKRWTTLVSQGCRPIGGSLTVTECQGNLITELDGEPPLQALNEIYAELSPLDQRLFQSGLLLGLQIGDSEEEYIIRNLIGIERSVGALVINDMVEPGRQVRFHVRDGGAADTELTQVLQRFAQGGRKAAGGMLFTCNGRGVNLFKSLHHDAGAIQREIGPIPLAGFFAAGELAPLGGVNYIHGFTAGMLIFHE